MKIINFKNLMNHIKIKNLLYFQKKIIENRHLKGKKYRKVRDYCHYTEEYRSFAHRICNLKYCVPNKFL